MVDDPDMENSERSGYVMTPEELKKRKERSLAIALAIGAFIVLIFLVTMMRLSASV